MNQVHIIWSLIYESPPHPLLSFPFSPFPALWLCHLAPQLKHFFLKRVTLPSIWMNLILAFLMDDFEGIQDLSGESR